MTYLAIATTIGLMLLANFRLHIADHEKMYFKQVSKRKLVRRFK